MIRLIKPTLFILMLLPLFVAGAFQLATVPVLAQAQPNPPSDFCSSASASAFCSQNTQMTGGNDPVNNSSSPILGPSSILYRLVRIVTTLTGAISGIMIMVGGFRYVVSGGDSNATKAAKDTILYAVIGLTVSVFAQLIITFVLSKL